MLKHFQKRQNRPTPSLFLKQHILGIKFILHMLKQKAKRHYYTISDERCTSLNQNGKRNK